MPDHPVVHILNGDALKDQFPKSLEGRTIVARECLVDGPVAGETLEHFYHNRASYLSEHYGGSVSFYFEMTLTEFEQIQTLADQTEINLWFEQDLFCQVNLWFVCWLLYTKGHSDNIYLVLPKELHPYGFGGYNKDGLCSLFENRTVLRDLESFAKLWEHYKNNAIDALQNIAQQVHATYPFLLEAVQAHIDRIPKNGTPGKPQQILLEIKEELDTDDFGAIFKEFSQRAPIYGFGDLQVKRLLGTMG